MIMIQIIKMKFMKVIIILKMIITIITIIILHINSAGMMKTILKEIYNDR